MTRLQLIRIQFSILKFKKKGSPSKSLVQAQKESFVSLENPMNPKEPKEMMTVIRKNGKEYRNGIPLVEMNAKMRVRE